MASVLKNFKMTKNKYKDFPVIKILSGEDVFVDLPICAVPFGEDFDEGVLFTREGNLPKAGSFAEIDNMTRNLKRFVFHNDKGHLTEYTEDEKVADDAVISWLPKDTKVEDLVYTNGEIRLIKRVKEEDSDGKHV